MGTHVVDTSKANWPVKLVKMYQDKSSFTLLDVAGLGIDLTGKSLYDVLVEAGLNLREVLAVMVALGVTGLGSWVVRMAIIDPEPGSKAVLAVIGAGLVALGFGSAYRVLTGELPADVELTPKGMKVSFAR